MGVGHVMRCLALAQGWQDRGGTVSFVTAPGTPDITERLVREGCLIHELKAVPGSAADAAETLAVVDETAASWLIVDGYHFAANYLGRVRTDRSRTLVLDDLATMNPLASDLVLNQNLQATADLYAGHADQPSWVGHLLTGSPFALLRREFLQARRTARVSPRPSGNVAARNVVITMGGSDPANVTAQVLTLLAGFSDRRLRLTVVVGPLNPHRTVLSELAAGLAATHDVEICIDPPDLPAILISADVAISAAGTSCWELACLGVPMLLVVAADNQQAGAAALAEKQLAIVLGPHAALDTNNLLGPLRTILTDSGERARLSVSAGKLIDGQGAGRVAERMAAWPVRLRAATSADAALLHEWANDPVTRQMSFSTDAIPWDTHVAWLNQRLADPDCRLQVALDAGDVPLGQIRLDRSGTTATLSVSVAPQARGRGYAARLVRLAAVECLQEGWCSGVNARVRPENAASLATFRRARFSERGLEAGAMLFSLV